MELNKISNKIKYEKAIQAFVIILIITFCLKLLSPFFIPILWAIILSIALFPLYKNLKKILRGRKKITAITITVSLLVCLIIPAYIFLSSATSSIIRLKSEIISGDFDIIVPKESLNNWPIVGEYLYSTIKSISENLQQTLFDNKETLIELVKKIIEYFYDSSIVFFQLILSIILAGVLLVSEKSHVFANKFIGKIAGNKRDDIIKLTKSTVSQVVKGVIGVALIQTLIQAIGLFTCNIPFAGILTLLSLFLSLIQIGPTPINLLILIFLLVSGEKNTSIIWTFFIVLSSLSDYVLKPILFGKGAQVPTLIIFIGVIGGFIMSGLIGLFVGPILLSIGFKLFLSWIDDEIK